MKKFKSVKKFKANPDALPALLDKEAETKRLDSIRKNADEEIKENDRLKEFNLKNKDLMNK